MAEMLLSLLLIVAGAMLVAGVVEGYCALRDRLRVELHADDQLGESGMR